MAITPAITNSFKVEVLKGVHNFTASTGDTFRIALLASGATASKSTTNFSDVSASEVGNSGTYASETSSQNLTSATPVLSGDTAVCDFTVNISWTAATISAIGAIIYNSSKSNAAVCVLDFGGTKTSTAGTFQVTFPTPDSSNAIVRIA